MRIYIASPFFNKEQIDEVNTIRSILERMKIKYYSPKDECPCKPNSTDKERFLIFDKNIMEIQRCDLMIVNTNNKDMGSIFEAGVAFSMGKPILYFNQQLVGDFNLMLCQSGMGICKSFEDLEKSIKRFKERGEFYEEYKGLIE